MFFSRAALHNNTALYRRYAHALRELHSGAARDCRVVFAVRYDAAHIYPFVFAVRYDAAHIYPLV